MTDGQIAAGAELGGSLGIQIHHHIFAGGKAGQDFAFQGAVAPAMDEGVFEKTPVIGNAALEFLICQEKVVPPIHLARPHGPRGAGNGVIKRRWPRLRSRQTVVFPDPDGPETTQRMPVR